MRILGFFLLLVALGILIVFLWPLIEPKVAWGPRPETFSDSRFQIVTTDGEQIIEKHHEKPPEAQHTGPLCDSLPEERGARPLSIPMARVLKRGPPSKPGSWTYINLWAAWCKPCKEEMPLIANWAAQARKTPVKVVFISIDDDERQLERYMSQEGQNIAGEFLWLREDRKRFYDAIGVKDPPTLPVQVILDPNNRPRCIRVGNVSRKELEEMSRMFGWED